MASRLERLVAAIERTEKSVTLAQIRLRRLRYEARIEMKKRAYSDIQQLSPRQQQVAELIRLSLSNKEIAAALGITVRTAKFHVSALLAKFKAQSRRDLPF